jgi:hypothetical protein
MSLLWKSSMSWWDERDEPEDYEHDIRDVDEPNKQRGQRYLQKVLDNHGGQPQRAKKAIQHVVKRLDGDGIWGHPTEYGFDSVSRKRPHDLIKDPDAGGRIYRPDVWEHRPVQAVPLDQGNMHATQDFIKHVSVAHNLFHAGKKQPYDGVIGDPDYDPIQDEPDHDDDDAEPDYQHLKHPRFLKTGDGKMYTLDGHHRVATDLLLGKRTTYGRVVHEDEL